MNALMTIDLVERVAVCVLSNMSQDGLVAVAEISFVPFVDFRKSQTMPRSLYRPIAVDVCVGGTIESAIEALSRPCRGSKIRTTVGRAV